MRVDRGYSRPRMENTNTNEPIIAEPSNEEKMKQLLTLIHMGLTAICEAIEEQSEILK